VLATIESKLQQGQEPERRHDLVEEGFRVVHQVTLARNVGQYFEDLLCQEVVATVLVQHVD